MRGMTAVEAEAMNSAVRMADLAKSRGYRRNGASLVWGGGKFFAGDEKSLNFPSRHAVMNVLRYAQGSTGRRIADSTLCCVVEPCLMCAAAAVDAGIKCILYLESNDFGIMSCGEYRGLAESLGLACACVAVSEGTVESFEGWA